MFNTSLNLFPSTKSVLTLAGMIAVGATIQSSADDITLFSDFARVQIGNSVSDSLHGSRIVDGGILNGVLTYLVHGDLRLLSGTNGVNGRTDQLHILAGANAVQLIVAGDVIQEPGAGIDASAGLTQAFGPGGGLGGGINAPQDAGAGGLGGVGGDGGGRIVAVAGRNGMTRGTGDGGLGGGHAEFLLGELRAYGGDGGHGSRGFGNGTTGEDGGERIPGNSGFPGSPGNFGAYGYPGLGGSEGGVSSILTSAIGQGGDGGLGGGGVGVGGSGADIIRDSSAASKLRGHFGKSGEPGSDGGSGGAGGPGAGGGGGRINNSAEDLELIAGGGGAQGNGGAGGGGGGGASSGGGGGGGGGGASSGGGGGGGGGGAVNILAAPPGGGGGGGGEGGSGGAGGRAAQGGRGGNGGGGGGALRIVALGRAWLNYSIRAEGGPGEAGQLGHLGSNGLLGVAGSTGGSGGQGEFKDGLGFGAGDSGGSGGMGGNGGQGGQSGRGGGGGGGGGGNVQLSATWLATDELLISTGGGAGGDGDGTVGQGKPGDNGRVLYGHALTAAPQFKGVVGTSLFRSVDNFFPVQRNPYAGGASTPRLVASHFETPGLIEGPAAFGVWPSDALLDSEIAESVQRAPIGATACLIRLSPNRSHPFQVDLTNHFVVAIVNLPSARQALVPTLAQGSDVLLPLMQMGWQRETLFGGDGNPITTSPLSANHAFFCVLPTARGNRVSFSDGNRTWSASLQPGQAVFNVESDNTLPIAGNLVPWFLGTNACANGIADGIPAGRMGDHASWWPNAIESALNSTVGNFITTEITAIDQGAEPLFAVGTLKVFGNVIPTYYSSGTDHAQNLPNTTTAGETVAMATPSAASRFNDQTVAGNGVINGRHVALYWTLHPQQLYNLDSLVPNGEAGVGSQALGIFGGSIVGFRLPSEGHEQAVIWTNGTALDLSVPSGFTFSRASDIERDLIVGRAITNGNAHACAWLSSNLGVPIDLHPTGWQSSEAVACNGTQVVGIGRDSAGVEHAIVWTTPTASAALDLSPIVGDWGGSPHPTGIDSLGNISLCASTGDQVNAWLLATPGVVFRPDILGLSETKDGVGGQWIDLTWKSRPGRTYRLESSDAFSQWTALGDLALALSAQTTAFHLGPISASQQFFRVVEIP